MQPSSDLVGSVEAADILGIDRSTLSRWSDERLQPDQRRITPVMRTGGRTGPKVFRRADVLALRDRLRAEREAVPS